MKSNQRKIGAVLSYLIILINAVAGLIYVPLMISKLGDGEYGLYQLLGSLVAYLVVMDFGLSTTVIKFFSQSQDGKKSLSEDSINILGMARRIYYVLTVIMILTSILIYINFENIFGDNLSTEEIIEGKKIFILLVINVSIIMLSNVYTALIISFEKFIFLKSLTVGQLLLQFVSIILLLNASPSAFKIVLIQTFYSILVAIIKFLYCKLKIGVQIKCYEFNKKVFYSMMSFSTSVFVVSVVDQIFWKSNQVILGITVGTSAVAIYSIAAQIYMNYMPLSSVIQGILLPKMSVLAKGKENDDLLSKEFIKIGRLQFILLACILSGFITYGQDFINLWVGEKYSNVYWITLLILIPFTIDLIQNLGLTILQAKNLYAFRAKLLLVMAVVNIYLTIELSSRYGVVGAAVSTSICMGLGYGIIMNYYYFKVVKLDVIKFWISILRLVPFATISVLLGFGIKFVIPITGWTLLIINIFIFLIVYVMQLHLFYFNKYEKNIIETILRKITISY